jgi:hypothetical protein
MEMNKVVKEAIKNLSVAIKEADAKIEIHPLDYVSTMRSSIFYPKGEGLRSCMETLAGMSSLNFCSRRLVRAKGAYSPSLAGLDLRQINQRNRQLLSEKALYQQLPNKNWG